MNNNERQSAAIESVDHLWSALASCPDLRESSVDTEALWLAIWQVVTTKSEAWATPMGSASRVRIRVTRDHADAELLAAWEWLLRHEEEARRLGPTELFVRLRGVATRSATGSARAANADRLCGMTNVPADVWIALAGSDVLELVA